VEVVAEQLIALALPESFKSCTLNASEFLALLLVPVLVGSLLALVIWLLA
jgi:hypothetical protein